MGIGCRTLSAVGVMLAATCVASCSPAPAPGPDAQPDAVQQDAKDPVAAPRRSNGPQRQQTAQSAAVVTLVGLVEWEGSLDGMTFCYERGSVSVDFSGESDQWVGRISSRDLGPPGDDTSCDVDEVTGYLEGSGLGTDDLDVSVCEINGKSVDPTLSMQKATTLEFECSWEAPAGGIYSVGLFLDLP